MVVINRPVKRGRSVAGLGTHIGAGGQQPFHFVLLAIGRRRVQRRHPVGTIAGNVFRASFRGRGPGLSRQWLMLLPDQNTGGKKRDNHNARRNPQPFPWFWRLRLGHPRQRGNNNGLAALGAGDGRVRT